MAADWVPVKDDGLGKEYPHTPQWLRTAVCAIGLPWCFVFMIATFSALHAIDWILSWVRKVDND